MKIPVVFSLVPQAFEPPLTHKRSLLAAHLRVLHLQLLPWARSGKGRRSPRRTDPIFCTLGHGGSEMEEWQSKCLVYWCDWCTVYCLFCWYSRCLLFTVGPRIHICHWKIFPLAEPNRGILRRSSSIPPPQPRDINWTLKIWASWVTVGTLEAWWLLSLPIWWFFGSLKRGGFWFPSFSLSPS